MFKGLVVVSSAKLGIRVSGMRVREGREKDFPSENGLWSNEDEEFLSGAGL